ncbi:MAG: HAMP domain-containing protein [Eggerthellaceae bacterium]
MVTEHAASATSWPRRVGRSPYRDRMGHGVQMARMIEGDGSGRDRGGRKRPGRAARLRERWRNASLKTSFMVYMLSFLLAALVLSISTGALFGDLQNQATADAYEISGLYLYDKDADDLVPARTVEVSMDGSTVLVQTVRNGMASIARVDLPADTSVLDASDYAYSSSDLESDSFGPDYGETSIEENFGSDLSISNLPSYDAWARDQFDRWLAENPASPYASFFPSGSADGLGSAEGLMASAVGYYLNTPPSPEAQALSAVFGLLSFIMFPLWFGVCIFAAARRFYRMRLAPGLAVLDDAAAKIASQDLDFTVSYDRGNELGRLARSFEDMRASLASPQRAWRTAEERKRLNAAFAHDLRTPLTVLKGKVELLEAGCNRTTRPPSSWKRRLDRSRPRSSAWSATSKP